MADLSLRTFDDMVKAFDALKAEAPPRVEVFAGSQAAVDACLGSVPVQPVTAGSMSLFGIPIQVSKHIPEDWVLMIPKPPTEVVNQGPAAVDAWRQKHKVTIIRTAVHA